MKKKRDKSKKKFISLYMGATILFKIGVILCIVVFLILVYFLVCFL